MGIEFRSTGSFDKIERFLRTVLAGDLYSTLDRFGQEGVAALASATPIDTGETSASWYYEVRRGKGSYTLTWGNRHVEGGAVIAVLIQYGHGTGTGGYVQGRDYINPAIRPLFDRIANEAWEAVKRA